MRVPLTPLYVAMLLGGLVLPVSAQNPVNPALSQADKLSGRSVGVLEYAGKVRLALLQMAQEHPEVLTAKSEATISGFEADTAKQARYPRFALGAATGQSATNTSSSADSGSFNAVTASVRMSLIDGGLISSRIRAADANQGAKSEAVKAVSQKVVLDGITAYLQVQRFDLKKRIAEKSTQILDELTRVEQRRVDLGAVGQGEAKLASSRRAGSAAKRQEFDALLTDAVAKFETYFKFRPNPSLLPALVLPKEWAVPSLDEAIRLAEASSSELAEARQRIVRANALVDREKASRFPTVDAVVSKTRDNRALAADPTRAALELNLNLGTGFDISSRIKSAIAEVDSQEAKLEAARANLVEVASAAYSRTASGAEREKQLLEAVSESNVAYQSRRRLLGFGRETLTNVLDAQLEHFSLLLDLVDAVFDVRVAEFRLARTSGRLLLEPNTNNAWLNSAVATTEYSGIITDSLLDVPGGECKGPGCGSPLGVPAAPKNPSLKQSAGIGQPEPLPQRMVPSSRAVTTPPPAPPIVEPAPMRLQESALVPSRPAPKALAASPEPAPVPAPAPAAIATPAPAAAPTPAALVARKPPPQAFRSSMEPSVDSSASPPAEAPAPPSSSRWRPLIN